MEKQTVRCRALSLSTTLWVIFLICCFSTAVCAVSRHTRGTP